MEVTGQEAGGSSGGQRLSSAHSEKLGGPALLAEVLNPSTEGRRLDCNRALQGGPTSCPQMLCG